MRANKISTSITPMLTVTNGPAAIEFYQKAFGAIVIDRFDADGKLVLCEMALDNVRFFVSEEAPGVGNLSPESCQGTTVRLELTIEDPDGLVARAIASGAKVIFPVANQEYGWRQGRIADPAGHQWVVGRPLRTSAEKSTDT